MNEKASTLIAIVEAMRIMKQEHNPEINISIAGADHAASF